MGQLKITMKLYLRFLILLLKHYVSGHYLRAGIRLRICALQPVLQEQASSILVVQLQTFSVLLKEKKRQNKTPATLPYVLFSINLIILIRYKLLDDREIRRPFMSFVLEHLLQIRVSPSEVLIFS